MMLQKTHKVIIVDDEYPARLMMRDLISQHQGIIEIVGEAKNGKEAISLITEKQPGIVFLDIQMPDMNGFEVLSKLQYNPKVVFTTAYNQYAIDAFKENAIDYLLKPIEKVRFQLCIDKISTSANHLQVDFKKLKLLFDQLQPKKEYSVIPIKIGSKTILVQIANVVYCKSKDGYVSVFTEDGKEHISDLNLNELLQRFPDQLLRVQKSYLVNSSKVKEVHKYFNNRLILLMSDLAKTKITTGTTYIHEIRSKLGL